MFENPMYWEWLQPLFTTHFKMFFPLSLSWKLPFRNKGNTHGGKFDDSLLSMTLRWGRLVWISFITHSILSMDKVSIRAFLSNGCRIPVYSVILILNKVRENIEVHDFPCGLVIFWIEVTPPSCIIKSISVQISLHESCPIVTERIIDAGFVECITVDVMSPWFQFKFIDISVETSFNPKVLTTSSFRSQLLNPISLNGLSVAFHQKKIIISQRNQVVIYTIKYMCVWNKFRGFQNGLGEVGMQKLYLSKTTFS